MPEVPEFRFGNRVTAGGTGDLQLGNHIPNWADLKHKVSDSPRTLQLTIDSAGTFEACTATVSIVGENLVVSNRVPSVQIYGGNSHVANLTPIDVSVGALVKWEYYEAHTALALLNQDVSTAGNPSFAGLTVNGDGSFAGKGIFGAGTSSEFISVNAGAGWADINLSSANTNGGSINWIDPESSQSAPSGEIFFYHPTNTMDFKTSNTLAMRLGGDQSATFSGDVNVGGRVGVGGVAPQNAIHSHVVGANPSRIQITNGTTGSAAADGLHMAVDALGDAFLIQRELRDLYISTNNTTRMLIGREGGVEFLDNDLMGVGKLTVDGGAKISVQNKVDGGSGNGLFLWDTDVSMWGMYMAQAGVGKSLADGVSCTALNGSSAYHIRMRANASTNHGFLWENSAEQCLMSLTSDTGDLYTKGDVNIGGSINISGLPVFADDTAAGVGGLMTNDVYKTSTGELRIKL